MSWAEDYTELCCTTLQEWHREPLWLRGVSDEQIEQFQIGCVVRPLPSYEAFPAVFRKWSGDGRKLVDCYMFPLTNWLGEVKGFQFRPMDRDRKEYMDFFLDSREPVFFGLGQAAQAVWETRDVCIVEGVFDFFPVQRSVPQTISTLTAKVTGQLERTLRRLVDRVYVFYDDDKQGRQASHKCLQIENLDVRLVGYPAGVCLSNGDRVKDPGDLWEAWGDDKLSLHLECQMR